MAVTTDEAYVREYESLVTHASQQAENRLEDKIRVKDSGGKSYSFPILGETSFNAKTLRSATPLDEGVWTTRVAIPATSNNNMPIESEEEAQMLTSPKSEYAMAQAMAYNRKVDDIIIAAAHGTALQNQEGASPSTEAWDTTYDLGAYTADISFALVTSLVKSFMEQEVTPDMTKIVVASPYDVSVLLGLTQMTSADFVHNNALTTLNNTGMVPNWMGCTWIMSNRLNHPATLQTDMLAFTPRSIGMAVNQNKKMRIGERADLNYLWQVYCELQMGAVRILDSEVRKIKVKSDIV